uniref:Uncharacterized protein n=1 Tax=Anguilla anguilla TaxID=7936 RepID=A0A0E9XDC8_ANGAN
MPRGSIRNTFNDRVICKYIILTLESIPRYLQYLRCVQLPHSTLSLPPQHKYILKGQHCKPSVYTTEVLCNHSPHL